MTSSSTTSTSNMIILPNRETVNEATAREQIAEDLKLSVQYYQFVKKTRIPVFGRANRLEDFGLTHDRMAELSRLEGLEISDFWRRHFETVIEIETKPPGRIISLLKQHPQLAAERFSGPPRYTTRPGIFRHRNHHPFPDGELFTPIAYMLLLSECDDLSVLRTVIDLCPEALLVPREENGNLLLHDFCQGNCRQNNQNEIVQLLLSTCHESAALTNNQGLSPLHLCLNNPGVDAAIVRLLVDHDPKGLLQVDKSTGMSCIARALLSEHGRENNLEYILNKIDELEWNLDSLLVTRAINLSSLPVKMEHFLRLLPKTRNMILRHVRLEGGEVLAPPATATAATIVETLELSHVQLTSGGTPAALVSQISGQVDNFKELTLSIISENQERYDITELAKSLLQGNRIERLEIHNGLRISMINLKDYLKSNKSLKQFYCENSLHFVESRKLLADILKHENDVLEDVAVLSQYSACPHVKRIVGWTMLNHCGRRKARGEATSTIPVLVSFLALLIRKLQPVREPLAQLRCRPTFETTVDTTLSLSLDSASVLNAQFCFLLETANIWSNAYGNNI